MQIRNTILLVPLASALLYACVGEFEDEIPPGFEDVEYLGTVSDKALAAFAELIAKKTPTQIPSQEATLDVPASGAAIPKIPLTIFRWHVGATASRGAPPPSGRDRLFIEMVDEAPRAPQWAAIDPAPRATDRGLMSPLRELLGPIRSARAHGDPSPGTATFMVFSTDTDPKLVRVLTSDTSYSPSQEAWDKLTTVGKPITVTLTTAVFDVNEVLEEGGPFSGSVTQFTVTM